MKVHIGDILQWVSVRCSEEIHEFTVTLINPPTVRSSNGKLYDLSNRSAYRGMSFEDMIQNSPAKESWIIKMKLSPFQQFVRKTLEDHDREEGLR